MNRLGVCALIACWWFCSLGTNPAFAHAPAKTNTNTQRSITNRTVKMPSWEQWKRVIFLQDYNTRIVLFGTTLLGCAAGVVGSFTLLRKRALMGDALSHATLPGICLAFIVATSLGYNGKSLPILLFGATLTGLAGVVVILSIRNLTRLKEDAALGIVLSVFFGAGIALLGIVSQLKGGHAAGLESFIYGKTASMVANDAILIASSAILCIGTCLLLFKELKLLCFDEVFAASKGVPIVRLDLILMALVVIVSIVGLQAVGLILMVALLIIPAAAARFWTERMFTMMLISGGLGAIGGTVGAGVSALFENLPSGAMIVLVCTTFFLFSMFFGIRRGLLIRFLRRRELNRTVDRQHLLRGMYELLESSTEHSKQPQKQRKQDAIAMSQLLSKRSWSPRRLQRSVRRAQRADLVNQVDEQIRLTKRGVEEAIRLTHQHRLWELYLITYADIAPSRVDRDADAIEHVLEPEIVAELESLLQKTDRRMTESPHDLPSSKNKNQTNSSEGR